MAAKPEVFNHNLETVPRLYLNIRPGRALLRLAAPAGAGKELMPTGFTKSGLMVGLGESREEIMQVMDDLRAARSISSPSASISSRPRSTPSWNAFGRRRNSRRWKRWPAPRAS
jgi:hypothetical protein